MDAKLISKTTGEVLMVFPHGTMDDILQESCFFRLSYEDAVKVWHVLMDALKSGEIYMVSPRTDGGFLIQVRGEYIEWIV